MEVDKELYINIRHVYSKKLAIFPGILSNEAMTDKRMGKIAGGFFVGGQVVVHKKQGEQYLTDGYWHLKSFLDARENIYKKQLSKNDLDKFSATIDKNSKNLIDLIEKETKKIEDNGDILKRKKIFILTYIKICKLYKEICFLGYSANLLDTLLLRETLKDLESNKLINGQDVDRLRLTMSRNPKANFLYNHDLDLIKLLMGKASDRKIDNHVVRWRVIFSSNSGGVEDPATLLRKRVEAFKLLNGKQLEKKREEIFGQYKQAEADIRSAQKKFAFDKKTIKKFQIMRSCILLKETRKLALVRISECLDNFFRAISGDVGLSADSLKNLLPDEIIKMAVSPKGGKIFGGDGGVDKLKEQSLFFIKGGKVKRYAGDSFNTFIGKLKLEPLVTKTDSTGAEMVTPGMEYKGLVACQGLVSGPAVIVMSPNDFHKVKKGDILVTSLTTPEYVLIFDLISGMVTFDGAGLTSHPATLAREYKKPAILGVRAIDGIVKDGDILEVDGFAGLVRIIN